MTERAIVLDKVQKAMAENSKQLKAWKLNAIMSEAKVKTTEKLLRNEERLYNDRVNKLKLAIDRAVKNAKISHKKLDELLEEKETLHSELKAASHFGKELCEYCKKYFTPQGITRHKTSCSMKPEVKIVKKHEKEIKEDKADLVARKAALQKELDDLEKAAKG